MSTMLRYVRQLRKLHHVGWRVTLNQPKLDGAGIKNVGNQLTNLSRSYATNLAVRQKPLPTATFQNMESQLKRTGRVFAVEIEHWLEETQSQKNMSSLNALLLIRSCGKSLIDADSKRSIQLVQKVFKTLESLKIKMDVSHYNALLNVYLEKDYDFAPDKFLSMMKEKNIEPNRITFQRLIAGYCNKGDIAGATKMLAEMKSRDMPLSEDIFISLIVGHSQSGDMESALKTLESMKAAGIHPSADIYATLMCAHAKKGNMDGIRSTFELMKKEEISLLDNHYLEIINVLASNGFVTEAEEFFTQLPSIIRSDTDICRTLIKLAFEGHLELALKLLNCTAEDPTRELYRSSLIAKALVLNGGKVEDVIHICNFAKIELKSDRNFAVIVHDCLQEGVDSRTTLKIMQAWLKTGGKIHEHFFWPLMVSHGKAGNPKGVAEILKTMKEDFNISPSIETIRDYAIPFMYGNLDDTIELLTPLGISKNDILLVTIERQMIERKLLSAAATMANYPAPYSKDVLLNRLALASWENSPKQFITNLRYLSDNSEAANPDQVPTSLVDEAVRKVISVVSSSQPMAVINLINELVASGLSISKETGDELRNYLGSKVTPELNESINKLTSGDLTIVPISEYHPLPDKPLNSALNRHVRGLGRKFNELIEQHDVKAIEDFLQKMETFGQMTPWALAQAIGVFSEKDSLELAKDCVRKFKAAFPEASLDAKKAIKFADLLVKNGQFEEAVKFIAEQPELPSNNELNKYDLNLRLLLEKVAGSQSIEQAFNFFELLRQKNYVEADNFTLGPLVKAHALANDLPKAMEAFERACAQYNCAPYKNKLATLLIEAEDASNLQKLTDMTTQIHGESSALVDLAFAFMECGKMRQARKIFETPGLQVQSQKIATAIEHLRKFHPEHLIQLVNITKSVARMDRGFMYSKLLDVFIEDNNWEQGLALWTEMQDDFIQPTNNFLKKLSDLLVKNNQKVPFVFDPEVSQETRTPLAKDVLILTRKLTPTLLTKYGYVKSNTFTNLAMKLVEKKQFDAIEELGNLLSVRTKDAINFGKIVCIARIKDKGLRHFVETYDMEAVQSDNLKDVQKNLHFGAMTEGLLKDDSCLEVFESWVNKLADKGLSRGKHAMWCYYFIKRDPKAEDLWKTEIQQSPSPLTRPITEYALQNKDSQLMETLKKKFESHPGLANNASARIYSDLMELYNSLERFEDSLKVFSEVKSRFRDNVVRNVMILDLKEGLEKIGKRFPYKIEYADWKKESNGKGSHQIENINLERENYSN
ncbi:Similar to Lrpprc: Leucine-rich PPR motif-containing protein [Cotesia congregata]|uniref:Mitochondrial (Rattus norvegicus) n=1 Tax=Cotesia congregata TaxID=51543 RepID=A0A8J2H7U9_COTCN|nr:Similar to Lrpprc: Leucine-rich PPR motif-containing protein [Cotesia congregata]